MVRIVAELAAHHLGDTRRLLSMCDMAFAAGADYVKVQKRDVETLYSPEVLNSPYDSPFGSTYRDYRHGLELRPEAFEALAEQYPDQWFVSVLDIPSYLAVKEYEPKYIKIPSTVTGNGRLYEHVARDWDGGVVVSTGMTTWQEERALIQAMHRRYPLFVLHCVSAYPAPFDELNLAHIRGLGWAYPHVYPGYSSHDDGSYGSVLAVAAGAEMIEKHVTLSDTEWVERSDVALYLDSEFAPYVTDIRRAEKMMGDGHKRVQPSEAHKYGSV